MDANHRLHLATKLHFGLLRHLGEGIDIGAMLKREDYALDVINVCLACDDAELRGRLRLVGAPVGSAEAAQAAVALNADVRLHIGRFDGPAERAELKLDPARKAYVHLARGRLTVSGHALNAGDALAIDGETALSLHDGQDAEVLVFELQP